jgi:hypothetical protein
LASAKFNTENKHITIENTKNESAIIQKQAPLAAAEAKAQDLPDLLLDITHLSMNKIKMNLEDLDAEVTVGIELTDQIHIDVISNVRFDNVNIDFKNVEIAARVKVNLRKISEIIDNVLKNIEYNPESVNIPVNMENVLAINLSLNQKSTKEALDKNSEKVIEGESRIRKD